MAFLLSHAGCRKPNCATAACNVACVFIGKSKIVVFRALFHVEGGFRGHNTTLTFWRRKFH